MKNLFLFLVSTFFIMSCTDKEPTTTKIEGTILQQETLIPIENAMVIFSQSYSKGLFEGTVEWIIDTAYTDADGQFTWETEINPRNETYDTGGAFSITEIVASNYYNTLQSDVGRQGNETRYTYLEQANIEVEMTPHAYLDINLINELDLPTNYCKIFAVNTDVTEELFGEDKSYNFIVPGNKVITYYFTTDINLDEFEIDSFYIGAFQTKVLDFTY